MIKQIKKSRKDFRMANPPSASVITKFDDCSNYESLVVKKPWGFEYLLFHNNFVAGWILYLNKENQTSMHCHPNKKTSLIVLQGQGIFQTNNDRYTVKEGEGFMIDKGVFHSTKAVSDMIVLEIESPPYKKDLQRIADEYGRAMSEYEGIESFINLSHKDYAHLPTLYNFKKSLGLEINIGSYVLSIHKHEKIGLMRKKGDGLRKIIVGILGNGFLNDENPAGPGHIMHGHHFRKTFAENDQINNEILIITKK